MNKNEITVFFRALHKLEIVDGAYLHNPASEYIEGYDYVMDEVKDAIFGSGEIENMYDLDNFINRLAADGADNLPGDYSKGYQDAVNICLEAVSQLTESESV